MKGAMIRRSHQGLVVIDLTNDSGFLEGYYEDDVHTAEYWQV